MPLPANTTTVVVLGTFNTPEGNPSTGTITFTPSAWLLNSGANIAIPNSGVTKTLGTAGNFSVTLPITDDADLSPTGWVYGVSEVIDGVSQSYNIAIPGTVASGGTVFLADLAPVAPAGPEYYSLASSLAIGTVTTVAPGGTATATITGLAPNQVLSLGLVRGDTGALTTSGSGSVGTAAVSPTGDPDTGIYYPAANQVAITTGGTAAATFAAGAISNPTFTGQVIVPAGSAGTPAISPTGDTNTGIFSDTADTLSIATGGTERVRVDSSGNVGVGAAVQAITNPLNNLSFSPRLEIAGTSAPTASNAVLRVDASASPGLAIFAKARGTGVTSPAAAQSGDTIGRIHFQAHDGTSYSQAADITAGVDSAPSTGSVPGRLAFWTTTSGLNPTEKMRIDSNGLITGTGTSLGAWTAFTPSILGGSTNPTYGTGTTRSAYYCQIGKIVHYVVYIKFGTSGVVAGSGNYYVNLPITSANRTFAGGSGQAFDASAAVWRLLSLRNGTSGDNVLLTYGNATAEAANVTDAAPWTWAASDEIRFTLTYEAA